MTGAGDRGAEPSRAVLERPAPPPDVTVRYGPLPDQLADVRFPPGRRAAATPLVVVVHGGFWRAAYDRGHTGPLAADLAGRGYTVAQLEYRRTGRPGGGWPGTFDDVRAGVRALPDLVAAAAGVPAGPAPPVLVGHSAGGHLALWYAATVAAGTGGVLALAPVADLAEAYRLDLDGGAVDDLLGGGPQDVPDRYAAADPARLPAPGARTLVLHGPADRQVPVELSRRYVSATGGRVQLREPDADHFALIDPRSPAWPTVVDALGSLTGVTRAI